MMDEYDQLSSRIEKLTSFIITDAFDDLPEIDRKDLKEQLQHMQGYFNVLSRRCWRHLNLNADMRRIM
jgi:hypothetical protein